MDKVKGRCAVLEKRILELEAQCKQLLKGEIDAQKDEEIVMLNAEVERLKTNEGLLKLRDEEIVRLKAEIDRLLEEGDQLRKKVTSRRKATDTANPTKRIARTKVDLYSNVHSFIASERKMVRETRARLAASPNKIIAVKTNVFRSVILTIDHIVSQEQPDFLRLKDICSNFMCIFETLSAIKYGQGYSVKSERIAIHSKSTFGSIAKSCKNAEKAKQRSEDLGVSGFLADAEKALAAVSDMDLAAVAKFDNTTRHGLNQLSHIGIAICAFEDLKLDKVSSDFTGAKMTQDLNRAFVELAMKVSPDEDLSLDDYDKSVKCYVKKTSVLAFVRTCVRPALQRKDLEDEANTVVDLLRRNICETTSDKRYNNISSSFELAEKFKTETGGGGNEKADGFNEGDNEEPDTDVYCSGRRLSCTHARRFITNLFFDLLRVPKILAHLPSGIFASEFEFIQFALFNSPHLVKNCVFGDDFFSGESKEAIVEKILDILSKKQMTTHLMESARLLSEVSAKLPRWSCSILQNDSIKRKF